jgi:hypothetical protein
MPDLPSPDRAINGSKWGVFALDVEATTPPVLPMWHASAIDHLSHSGSYQ